MSDDNLLKIDSTIRDSLDFYDNNQEKYSIFFNKVKFIKFIDNNNIIDDIIFYDENKKILLESSYEIMGVFLPKSHVWKWSWSIPTIHKKYTFISRKILEYAFNLDHKTELPLRSDLINSKIKILNDLQLDIHIALSSYVGKQPLIFKFYNKFDDHLNFQNNENEKENENENGNLHNSKLKKYVNNSSKYSENDFFKYISEDTNNTENYMIMYLFILDYDNITI